MLVFFFLCCQKDLLSISTLRFLILTGKCLLDSADIDIGGREVFPLVCRRGHGGGIRVAAVDDIPGLGTGQQLQRLVRHVPLQDEPLHVADHLLRHDTTRQDKS